MKKGILLLAVAGAFIFTSCKKDYTCTCTINGVSSSTTMKDVKKKDAEDACSALSVTAAIGGGSCSL